MRNLCLLVAYDGTAYHGWQCQPNAVTVQETVWKAIEKVTDQPVKLYGAARTDSGVHAMGQVVNFHTDSSIELTGLIKGINSLMPLDIRVRGAHEVPEDFHSRYSARSKTYVYCIFNSPYNSPFYGRYAWHIPYVIDTGAMHDAAQILKGTHDFASFKKKDETYRTTVREILRSGVRRRKEAIYVVLQATGFLRYMVRNIVGTLVQIGSGRVSEEEFRGIMESRDRQKAGPTAPPQGLFLRRIEY